jgi:hypothetical protein
MKVFLSWTKALVGSTGCLHQRWRQWICRASASIRPAPFDRHVQIGTRLLAGLRADRNRASAAISSRRARRPNVRRPRIAARISSETSAVIVVSVGHGLSTLTLMPRCAVKACKHPAKSTSRSQSKDDGVHLNWCAMILLATKQASKRA